MESLHLSFNRAIEAGIFTGMSINLKKSHILGLGIRGSTVSEAAASLGCSVMKTPFNYLGIMVSDLNRDGVFRVKDVRNLLDEFFLPRADVPTSRVHYVMRFLKILLTYSSIVLWLEM
nr:RNA-directed DNA polymerase, eukaryota, reverse transcriptase zinc-binding domain protein [Tanacetum cinerariifolium]